MNNEKQIVFDPFSLDPANECLWKGAQAIKVRPKAFTVLEYLLARPGQLVTKEELLTAVWPGTFVGEAVLKVAIRELREVLGDDAASPRFIETAHRRGYRFIGRIAAGGKAPVSEPRGDVVGREKALSRMEGWLKKTLAGERQIVFVTGEPGIGKTSLVDTFVRSIISDRTLWIARGQCLEQYGTGEAYLPVLEAIGRLCREHKEFIDVLRTNAPMWLLQMPSLVSASDREVLNREVSGASRERMLREIADALEVLTEDVPLVLVLEDLHWSDYSTLDLISYLATHRQSAQMMLIGTYRPVELIVSGHPLKAVKSELLAKHQCEELALEYLSEEAIARYLSIRFPANRFPADLPALIHERTEGSPLFMVNAVDYLVAERLVTEHEAGWELVADIDKVDVGVPDSIKRMIEKQIDHLDAEEQRTLEAASVAGAEFSIFAVAAALDADQTTVESKCDQLARRRQFIQATGLHRYGFIHALYQNVFYDRLPASKRAQVHGRIGEWSERFYGERAGEMAGELAMHFDRAANYRLAVRYLQQAAENDIRRFAYREAVALARRGLELVSKLPETSERIRQELSLQITLGVPLIATEGYAAADVGNTYTRALELCRKLGEAPELPQVLWGLWTFHLVRAALGTARELAEEFVRVAERLPYSGLAMQITLIHLGEFVPAMQHFKKALSLYDPERHRDDAFRYAQNAAVAIQAHAAWAMWFLGEPDQAVERMHRALALAHDLSEPHGLAHVFFFSAILHQLRREKRIAQEHAEAALRIAGEHKLLLYHANALVTRAWARTEPGRHEAIEELRQGLAAHDSTRTELLRPHFLALLVDALGQMGQAEEALRVVEEGLAVGDRNREHYYHAELYRLKGEALMQSTLRRRASTAKTAETCFHRAIQVAHSQNAKSFELRGAMSLARLYRRQDRSGEARARLAEIYDRFTEGFDTPDLREARALLDDMTAT